MAPPVVDVKDLAPKSNVCNKCKNSVKSGLKCMKCDIVFHPSCAKNCSYVTFLDNNKIVCCDSAPTSKDDIMDPESNAALFDALEKVYPDGKVDLSIFSYIIRQKDTIIKQLEEKVMLLNSHISVLNAKHIDSINLQKTVVARPVADIAINEHQQSYSEVAASSSSSRHMGNPEMVSKQNVAEAVMNANTQLKCNHYINLGGTTSIHANDSPVSPAISLRNHDVDNDGFQKVTRRKPERKSKKMGTGDGDKTFHGKKDNENRKLWLFISRVPDSVNSENVKQFLQTKTNSNQVEECAAGGVRHLQRADVPGRDALFLQTHILRRVQDAS
ncbi:unnamed protein product [Phaedon cochleariae]|uniref:Phorbol-ester/DAG-type domain-containing protein n=1 Tax=Phaedon cochleariae TaxID=80249 RepID=A0A9N9SFX8_PHACE|nr:unnamed protein product [Phaedon cochleariae]